MLLAHAFLIGRKSKRRKLPTANNKIEIAFVRSQELNNWTVRPPLPQTFPATPRRLIGGSLLLLAFAAVFGVLSLPKIRSLRSTAAEAVAAREVAERYCVTKENELMARESAIAARQAKLSERESKTLASEEQLKQFLNEKKQVEAKLQDKEADIAELQKQIEEKQPASANPGAPSNVELQAQLDDARQQLDNAEHEKSLLAEKMAAVRERASQLEEEKKRRAIAHGKVGVRGKILAVNQAYNFVVLNLGGRNGVEPYSEMLIVRDGTFIAKIRISSVEPATAIGDIITSTLARGVQVQPGDIVIYAGSNS